MTKEIATVSGLAEPLIARYRGLICDLDGVVYRGAAAVPHAVETVTRLTADGVPVVFATNNASRSPEGVGDHLRGIGLAPGGWSVVNSSQAAAAYLAQRLARGGRVYAVGGPGVAHALAEAGLTPVRVAELEDAPVEAVVQGLGIDITWTELAAVGRVVEGGATWVATNLDLTLPTPYGKAPGNGALVALVQTATSAEPNVVGKPQRALFDLARSRLGSAPQDTLVCGDLLHTDIEGANAAGLDSLFVLSGSSRLRDLALAERPLRPTYVAADVGGLLAPALAVPGLSAAHLLELGPGGVPLIPRADDPGSGNGLGNGNGNGLGNGALLQAVVATAWAARDEGRPVSDDAGSWEGIERRLGLVQPP
ncbi:MULTISPECIES: HAD-IIA family hydrolase [Prauserella salsuginis group]|uniref:HAD-IIA family hydrolase n=1 Tax=Prauserella salsuginis TaxID=387889 RepID=A0ABW6GC04_9PSEU|nr:MULTISPECIES: HAD-IIA family hydrolase [Prauserella salsuginis group]MCR3718053.1 Haloacid Dehalogenase Superfamily Class (subfamily) IIA [Prauserella flava]MCR3732614.1 Haloacid Dehalogenase Superfamily Class (subfamily) IIA [Prauserella salsuginis]